MPNGNPRTGIRNMDDDVVISSDVEEVDDNVPHRRGCALSSKDPATENTVDNVLGPRLFSLLWEGYRLHPYRHNTSAYNKARAMELLVQGYTVIAVPALWSARDRGAALLNLRRDLSTMPEFKPEYVASLADPSAPAPQLVGGGFAALGNPSSFHLPSVRHYRDISHDLMEMVLQEYVQLPDFTATHPEFADINLGDVNVSQVMDRILVRCRGQAPTADSWHRDNSPAANDGTRRPRDEQAFLVFGGWLNPAVESHGAQKFTCKPGSHAHVDKTTALGFDKITDEGVLRELNANPTTVDVPPGCILLFHSNILHNVYSVEARADMFRIFLGMYISTSTEALYPGNTAQFLKDMDAFAAMVEKSSQVPRMYPILWWSLHIEKLLKFSAEAFDDSMLITKRRYFTKLKKSADVRVIPEEMDSLAVLAQKGLLTYNIPQYKLAELQKYLPHPMCSGAEHEHAHK